LAYVKVQVVCGAFVIDDSVCMWKECLTFIYENRESLTDPVVPDGLVGSDLQEKDVRASYIIALKHTTME
jgi:hypothetical protein